MDYEKLRVGMRVWHKSIGQDKPGTVRGLELDNHGQLWVAYDHHSTSGRYSGSKPANLCPVYQGVCGECGEDIYFPGDYLCEDCRGIDNPPINLLGSANG